MLKVRQKQFPQGNVDVADNLNNLAIILRQQGKLAEGEQFCRQALTLRQRLFPKGNSDVADSLTTLANYLLSLGKFAEAEHFARQGLALRQTLFPAQHPEVADGLTVLGMALQNEGKFAEAETYFRQALAVIRACYPQGHPHVATCLNNLAILLDQEGHYAEAEKLHREALQIRRQYFPAEHLAVADSLNALGGVLVSRDQADEAVRLHTEAWQIRTRLFPHGHPNHAPCLTSLGTAMLRLGKAPNAEAYFRRALDCQRQVVAVDHPYIASCLNNLGIALLAQHKTREAEQTFQEALGIIQAYALDMAQVKSEGEVLTYLATFAGKRDLVLSAALRDPPPPAHQTYGVVWQNKAALLRLFEQRHLLLRAMQQEAKVQPLLIEVQDLRRQRERLLLLRSSNETDARNAQLTATEQRLEELQRQLRAHLERLGQTPALAKSTPEQLQQALPASTVFIDLLRYTWTKPGLPPPGRKESETENRYLAFVVTKQAIHRIELGAAQPLEEALNAWRQAILRHQPTAEETGRKVAKLVWEPLAAKLPSETRTIYLSPDMALTTLPWAALPDIPPQSLLLERYTFLTVPHGPFLLDKLTRRPAPPTGQKTLLALGGVSYDGVPSTTPPVEAALPVTLTQSKTRWKSLPGTAAEVAVIKRLAEAGKLQVQTLEKQAADTTRLQTELPRARYAHLATHGFFADAKFRSALQLDESLFQSRGGELIGAAARNPLIMSGLVLAGANRPEVPDRGIITADSLINLPLENLELVVLSACDTGLGATPAGGEGCFGLQRAFHIAGCQHVLASLWKVEDAPTMLLMEEFYTNLWQRQMSKAEALRQAQLTLWRQPDRVAQRWRELVTQRQAAGERGFEEEAQPLPASKGPRPTRSPAAWWAAFHLSGLGD